jgi:hypothetical protein
LKPEAAAATTARQTTISKEFMADDSLCLSIAVRSTKRICDR